jgi:hypothetical protein
MRLDRETMGRDRVAPRARTAVALLVPARRLFRWQPLAGAWLAGAMISFQMTKGYPCLEHGTCLPLAARVGAARLCAVLLALAAAFLLDDPAEDALAHVPTPRWLIRTIRLAIALPVLAVLWLAGVWITRRTMVGAGYPIRALTLEAASMCALSLAVAAAAARHGAAGGGGIAGAPSLLVLLAGLLFASGRWDLLPESSQLPQWHQAHVLWSVVLLAGLAGLAFWSRDPGRSLRIRPAERPSRSSKS